MATYTLGNFRGLPVSNVEELKNLEFENSDVLSQVEDTRVRRTNIEKALSLAKSERYTTALVMAAGGKLYRTDTAVKAFDGEFVYTGSGLKIPLACILSVDFFS